MIKVAARLAENTEGELVEALLEAQHAPLDPFLRFDQINPYWLVVELPGRGVVGCVQTCPSRPIGRLEMMATDQSLNDLERGLVVRELILAGCALLAYHGATHAAGFVSFSLKGFKRALKRHGAAVAETGNMLTRRIA